MIVIFHHMFKTGGTTVRRQIVNNFSLESHSVYNTSLRNMNHPIHNAKVQFITGHFLFGIHRYLSEECKYITFLRDPVERLASVYYQSKQQKRSIYHHLVKDISLAEFIQSQNVLNRIQTDNYYVRELVGMAYEGTNTFWMKDLDLERAIYNIQRYYVFIDFTYNMDQALENLTKKFGWNSPKPELCLNNNPGRPKVSKEERILSKRRNYLDYQLFEWVENNKDKINLKKGNIGK